LVRKPSPKLLNIETGACHCTITDGRKLQVPQIGKHAWLQPSGYNRGGMSTPLFGIMGKHAGVAAKTFLDGREARLLPRLR
jgi:hypothetical protein